MSEAVTTYLLEGLALEDISELHGQGPVFFKVNPRTGHGIFVSAAKPNGGGSYRVARALPGDNSDVVSSWIESRTMDGLVEAFERNPPTRAARDEAYAWWLSARARREALVSKVAALKVERDRVKAELEQASQVEDEASLEMVRTHGREVVWVDGDRWEPVVSRDERVYYRRKRS